MKRLLLSAGEASGDAYGAALVAAIRDQGAAREIGAIGGSRLRAQGVALVADSGRWGAISIVQSLAVVPRAVGGFLAMKRELARGEPGTFVPIDFGWVNVRLARFAKRHGWRVVYFIPPGSWRRDRQGGDLPSITNAIITPFSWSADLLRAAGANAFWFGHPIKSLIGNGTEARQAQIAVLPGSRKHELSEHLPVIAEALRGVELPAEFALAPSVDVASFAERWNGLAPGRDDRFTPNDVYGVLRRSRTAIVGSGTATLEAGLCGCPMVVLYKGTKSMVVEARLIGWRPPKFVALPNILLDRRVVPEFVQYDATPENLRRELTALLPDGDARSAQLAAFGELAEALGPSDAIARSAELILGDEA